MLAPPSPNSASLQQRTDDWFRRASASLLGQLPCRAGCSHCCIGPFAITVLDVLALAEGLKHLPSTQREDIQQRAIEQTTAMEAAYPVLKQSPFLDRWIDKKIDRLVNEFRAMPCPALGDDGLCRLYEYRPLTCRSMGIPLEEGLVTQGACSVQTFVPIVRLSASIRAEEQSLAEKESAALDQCRRTTGAQGEEVLLPYGFLSDLLSENAADRT
jgi:Fe-S-cluster containining protein